MALAQQTIQPRNMRLVENKTIVSQTINSPKMEYQRALVDKEVAGPILVQTSNYSQFTPSPINRDLNKTHVNYLIKEMKRLGFNKEYPIKVNTTAVPGVFQIICGHHRFEAAKQAGVPIWWTTTPGTRPEAEKAIPWRGKDFIGMYAKEGLKDYQRLVEWTTATGLSAATVTQLVCQKGGKKTVRGHALLTSGRLNLTAPDHAKLNATQKAVIETKEYLGIETSKNSNFFLAIIALAGAGLFDSKLAKHQFGLTSVQEIFSRSRMSSKEEALDRLDQMLNFRVNVSKKVDFVAKLKQHLRDQAIANISPKKKK